MESGGWFWHDKYVGSWIIIFNPIIPYRLGSYCDITWGVSSRSTPNPARMLKRQISTTRATQIRSCQRGIDLCLLSSVSIFLKAEKCIGAAMVFSLVSIIEERLGDYVQTIKSSEKKASEKSALPSYNEVRVYIINPTTVFYLIEIWWNTGHYRTVYRMEQSIYARGPV